MDLQQSLEGGGEFYIKKNVDKNSNMNITFRYFFWGGAVKCSFNKIFWFIHYIWRYGNKLDRWTRDSMDECMIRVSMDE